MKKKVYVLTCPVCGWRAEGSKNLKSFLFLDMGRHFMEKHRDRVAEWFREKNNRKYWYYVRREVLRILKSGEPVLVSPFTQRGYSGNLHEKLKALKDPQDFLEELCKAYMDISKKRDAADTNIPWDERLQITANYHALMNLTDWIGIYWVEHNTKLLMREEEKEVELDMDIT